MWKQQRATASAPVTSPGSAQFGRRAGLGRRADEPVGGPRRSERRRVSGAAEKLKGKANELKGAAKQKIGEATDNGSLQAEGRKDQASGEAEQAVAEIKDAVAGDRHNV